ncbi:MAG: HAD family phosphatase [Elusimicrobiota bacterium]|jgi:putative hydrolase of the HAD superfamily
MSDRSVDLIIFDLGRVLVDFDFNHVVRGLKRHSTLSKADIHHYFRHTPLWDAFERGKVLPGDFFQQLQKELHLKDLTFETFTALWNSIFKEKHDSVALLRELRSRYRLAMLSNVNKMHWDYVAGEYDFMKWFDFPVASYAVGYRKPDEAIYRIVLKKAGVAPDRAVFIDDMDSHVQAARALGIRAHQFTSAHQLRKDLAGIL